MKIPVTLIKGDKIGDGVETDYRDALPVNMYAVKRDILGAQGYMLCYPGLTKIADGQGKDRAANYNERFEEQYRLSGTKLIKVATDNTVTVLGTIPGTSQATMQDFYSFNTQGIIADGKFFLYDSTTGFREVVDGDLGLPIDGCWVDGYYFMTDGEYLFHTDITNEESIDPLKFATAEFSPDPTLGISKNQDNKVLAWGRYTLEYFVNDESEDFSFRRVETRAQKIGIVATHAKCELGTKFFITGGRKGDDVAVHAVSVGSSEKVSTRDVDKIIKQYTEPELSNMRMECRTENDISFVMVHLPNEVLCFNESIAKSFGINVAWAILKTDTDGNKSYRGINGVFDANRTEWVYGDKIDTTIGVLDNDVCTHYGVIVEWLLFTPLLKLETYSINEIELETIPGHTTTEDATVAVSVTYNGVVYSNEYWQLYGDPNDYNQRFILWQLGYVSDWVGFKFRGASKSRMAFGLLQLDYS